MSIKASVQYLVSDISQFSLANEINLIWELIFDAFYRTSTICIDSI